MLKKYQQKRNLKKSGEPAGKVVQRKGRIFVVQKHQASHLHWDFRLEDEGVLKSWAIPKEPPLKSGIKRLAVKVEDHPIEYAKFEGKIPEGNYGAGTVEIWDKGKYEMLEKERGKYMVKLKGKKMKGKYVLIKTKYAKNSWLIFKS